MKPTSYALLLCLLLPFSGCKKRMEKLHRSAKQGDVTAVRKLLAAGVAPDSLNQYGATPLCYAAYGGHPDVADLLIQHGADANRKCNIVDGNTAETWWPLDMAVRRGAYGNPKGHEAVAVILIENGADVRISDRGGFTPLHHAHFSERLIRRLVEKGADINAKTDQGETPLHVAVRVGADDAVRVLLELGANIGAVNDKGETARDYADKYNAAIRQRIIRVIDSVQDVTEHRETGGQ